MQVQDIDLGYCYSDPGQKSAEPPSAYEHLLLDALRGDPTFFARADEVEVAWEVVQPVLDAWGGEKPTDFPNYKAGSSGPSEADELLARDGRRWCDST
jgi:glucose-6-phosphate 1-dehydrogenase